MFFALARRGAIGGTSGSRPPRSTYVGALPKVAIRGWRWGTWWEMSQGTRGTMTGAHLGDRGACRRRSCSATAAPREGGRRRGHGDGRHHPRPQRSFFHQILPTTWDVNCLPFLCSWTRPTVSKPALVWLTAISLDGRAAGLTDARNFILAVPVSSESLPRSIKPADGQESLLKGSECLNCLTPGAQQERIWDPHLRGGGCPKHRPWLRLTICRRIIRARRPKEALRSGH